MAREPTLLTRPILSALSSNLPYPRSPREPPPHGQRPQEAASRHQAAAPKAEARGPEGLAAGDRAGTATDRALHGGSVLRPGDLQVASPWPSMRFLPKGETSLFEKIPVNDKTSLISFSYLNDTDEVSISLNPA